MCVAGGMGCAGLIEIFVLFIQFGSGLIEGERARCRPEPVVGTPRCSKIRWTWPSSPNVPCNATNATSSRTETRNPFLAPPLRKPVPPCSATTARPPFPTGATLRAPQTAHPSKLRPATFHSFPTIITSVSNSIPRSLRARSRINPISPSTSAAVAPPSFTIKLPWSSETRAPPTLILSARVPRRSIAPPGIASGFLKIQPALGFWADWIPTAFSRRPALPFDDRPPLVCLTAQNGGQGDVIGKNRTAAVRHGQVLRIRRRRISPE